MSQHLMVAAVLLTGCVTRGDVEDTVTQSRAGIDPRITKVEAQVGTQTERVGWVEGKVVDETQKLNALNARVEAAATSVNQVTTTATAAHETATGATARADAATAKADEVNSRMTRLWRGQHVQTVVSTSAVRFRSGKADLSDEAQTALTSMAKGLKNNPALVVELRGYADATGAPDQNIVLSQRRADAVRRFLVQQGVSQAGIDAIGLGAITDHHMPAAEKRRVVVRVLVLGSQ